MLEKNEIYFSKQTGDLLVISGYMIFAKFKKFLVLYPSPV